METRIMLNFVFSVAMVTRVEVHVFHFMVPLCQFSSLMC